ncbi:MAG: Holin family protein [Verrucomicrobia bacterium ADurb.Bin345]|nr:MAG: Holin family protein [Verrucomicrobia bacterium ADurb.Bin345]
MNVLLVTLLNKALGAGAMVFQTATVCSYIANQGISVIQSAGLMGLPVPDVVKHALEWMREGITDIVRWLLRILLATQDNPCVTARSFYPPTSDSARSFTPITAHVTC